MDMKKLLFILLLALLGISFSCAQHPFVSGEMIVWLKGKNNITQILRQTPFSTQSEKLSNSFNIHLLRFSPDKTTNEAALEWFLGREEVQFAQLNYLVESRHITSTLPNDPSFASQWSLHNTGQAGGLLDADIDAPEAWDISTGGPSAHGDSIVIAVVDEGADTVHQDLRFWVNRLEIPHNQIDDDKNGLVDDYRGWNFYDDDDTIPSRLHGTHVAGIAAASGDNNSGIAGVNWDARILNIAGSSGNQARVVRAYSYAYDMRRRYDETAGREGAYVVVINSSFGVNNGNPANFPIWCALYDSLGQRGILNVVSTTNSFVNVDVVGDMPSTCPSPFIIAVTATDNRDKLHTAGFGKTHIDLGAPGVRILSTIPGNSYSTLTGTSMAAPHVSGAVSLLHAKAGAAFQAWYKSFPDSMALLLKDCLLQATDSLGSLKDSTLTGGRLNLHKSLQQLQGLEDTLPTCTPPWHPEVGMRTDSSVWVQWKRLPGNSPFHLRYREQGAMQWQSISTASPFYHLSDLKSCQLYELQIASVCGSDSSLFTRSLRFESEGCCRPPAFSEVLEMDEKHATLSWSSVYAAQNYRLEYKARDSVGWISLSLADTSEMLSGLSSCTEYEYRLAIGCDSGFSSFSPVQSFRSLGCGQCLEGSYCSARATDSQEDDWIESFQLDTLINQSGPNQGYGDFIEKSLTLKSGEDYAFRLEPGFKSLTYSEYWRIWIDFNRDGDFLDSNELLYDGSMTTDSVVTGMLSIPPDLFSGPTRLRVVMEFLFAPDPCGNFQFGEVEDYCVDIDGRSESIDNELIKSSLLIYPNPSSGKIQVISAEPRVNWQIVDLMGRIVLKGFSAKKEFEVDLSDLKAGAYLLSAQGKNGFSAAKIMKE